MRTDHTTIIGVICVATGLFLLICVLGALLMRLCVAVFALYLINYGVKLMGFPPLLLLLYRWQSRSRF